MLILQLHIRRCHTEAKNLDFSYPLNCCLNMMTRITLILAIMMMSRIMIAIMVVVMKMIVIMKDDRV